MLRKFVSLMLLYMLIIMVITGTVLFIMPHGRVAYWTGWTLLGLDKTQWDNLHIISGFLMLFFGIWHLILNWRPIVNYLKTKDFALATALTGVVAFGAIANIPPFKTFIDFGEKIKNSWPKPKTMPPVPHAELYPLTKIAKLVGLSPEKAIEVLKSKGYKVPNPNLKLKEIARLNGTTPAEIYEALLEAAKKGSSGARAPIQGGMGMLTLKELCQKLAIEPTQCLKKLESKGIKAELDKSLREIAFENSLYPYQILEILEGGKDGEAPAVGHK